MTPSDTCSIRQARVEDATELAELITQLGYESTAAAVRQRMRDIIADDTYRTLVAVKHDAVVGVVGIGLAHYYERNGRYARILVLSVADGERGAGIGSALLAEAEKSARAAGAISVIVNSANHRADAHAFYESHGYAPTGLRFVKALDAPNKPQPNR